MSASEELLERRKHAVANGVGVFNKATVSHAKGAIITDTEGRELIDFAGVIGVVNAGQHSSGETVIFMLLPLKLRLALNKSLSEIFIPS